MTDEPTGLALPTDPALPRDLALSPDLARPAVSRRDAFSVWLRIALQSFGGPAGQIAVVHRIVVDEKKWLGEQRFLHALSYCMLLPGPEAQQLVTYIGWLLHGVRGGLVAGCLFIAPGFISILALSVLYSGYRDVTFVAGAFYGIKAAVIAVVLEAVMRLRRRALTEPSATWFALAAFVAIFALGLPFPLIVLAAAIAGYLAWGRRAYSSNELAIGPDVVRTRRPSLAAAARTAALWLAIWIAPIAVIAVTLGAESVFVKEGIFFSKAAVVTFGGAYSVLSYVAQQAVETYQWVTPSQMLDGLGMAESTPGPLIQVVQFVGFMGAHRNPGGLTPLTAGVVGSLVTAWVTFVPSFLFIFVGAPFVEHLSRNRALTAALRGITAAVVGVILNLAVWFALHALFGTVRPFAFGPLRVLVPVASTLDWRAMLITTGAIVAMFRWKLGMLPTLGAAAVVGILMHL